MGWTSVKYIEASHTSLTGEQAYNFLQNENGSSWPILKYHFVPAKDKFDHNEFYAIWQHPNGHNFICVTIIDIVDGEIYWKDITESEGPAYCNCPVEFFEEALAGNDYAIKWREECTKRNIHYVETSNSSY